jgi:p-aminobenzoyl-glutamate transporter AbgT
MEPNIKAARVHRALFVLYAVFTVLMVFAAITLADQDGSSAFIGYGLLMAFLGMLHWFIAAGARASASWAKTASVVVGCLMLLGFPLGTIIGAYLIYYGAQAWD